MKKLRSKEIYYLRYSSLVDIWSHHNTMQLQWPSITITTVLIVLSILFSRQLDKFLNINLWGYDKTVIFMGGIPMLLIGMGTCTMIYLMGRAKRVMIQIEKEIIQIEKELEINGKSFYDLNHPKGFSGAKIARLYLIIFIAYPFTFIGFLMTLGIVFGITFCIFFGLASLYIEIK